jgi:hypothetical protein
MLGLPMPAIFLLVHLHLTHSNLNYILKTADPLGSAVFFNIYYVRSTNLYIGTLVKFEKGPAEGHYGILIIKDEKVVKLDNSLMIDKKWFVVTPVGAFWSSEHYFCRV